MKKNKLIFGILIVALLVAGLIYGSQSFTLGESLTESPVWSVRYSSAKCSGNPTQEINRYSIESEDDEDLVHFDKGGYNDFLIYRCGYGSLKEQGDSNAYVRQCSITANFKGGGTFRIWKCKNEYDGKVNPESSDLCQGFTPEALALSSLFNNEKTKTYTTEDLANTEGTFSKSGKYTIYAIGYNDGIISDISSNVIINAQPYELDIIEGNGYRFSQIRSCDLSSIIGGEYVFPSSLTEVKTNEFDGKKQLGFDRTINWIWGYSPLIGNQRIKHNILGDIYVDREGSYIPVEKKDGVWIAFETNRKQSSLIECVPNRLGCSLQAKIIKDPEEYTCSEYKGLAQGDRTILQSGKSCVYNCVSGKPVFSSCKVIDEDTCSDGYKYDEKSNECIKIDSSNTPPPPINKEFDYTPLFIIGIIALIAIAIILVSRNMKKGKRK